MSRVLVMTPIRSTLPRWLRRLFPNALLDLGDPDRCQAVVVVNDHSPSVISLLKRALEFRRTWPTLPIVVLTAVDTEQCEIDAVLGGLAGPGAPRRVSAEQALAAIASEALPVEVNVSPVALNFELEA